MAPSATCRGANPKPPASAPPRAAANMDNSVESLKSLATTYTATMTPRINPA